MRVKYILFFLMIISCRNNDAQEGDRFYNNQDYKSAIEYYNESIKLNPNNVKSIYRREGHMRRLENIKMHMMII